MAVMRPEMTELFIACIVAKKASAALAKRIGWGQQAIFPAQVPCICLGISILLQQRDFLPVQPQQPLVLIGREPDILHGSLMGPPELIERRRLAAVLHLAESR